jgi:translocation and assembly module TamB
MRLRRHLWYAIPLLLAVLIVSCVFWVLYTLSGTAFFVKGMRGALSGTVEVKGVEGRIGHSLHVEGIIIRLEDLTVVVDGADLKWHPLHLVTGKLAITSLTAAGVSVTARETPEEPVDLSLPRLPKWFTLIDAWIKQLKVNRLAYRAQDSEPLIVKDISATVLLDRGTLFVSALHAESPYGRAKGSASINLVRPALQARFTAALPERTAGIDTISVDARFPSSRGKEEIAGPLVVKAFSGKQEGLDLRCTVGVSPQAVRISNAKFSRKDAGGTIEAQGKLDFSRKEPAFAVSAKIGGLDIGPETKVKTDISGDLRIAGTTEDFEGTFSLGNKGESWKDMTLRGKVRGDAKIIELKDVEAKVLGGAISGNISASRGTGMRLSARFTGSGLNPARLRPDLEGNLNIDVKGQLVFPEEHPVEGSLTASLKKSTFRKRAVSAEVDASFRDEIVRIKALSVKGNGFAATAAGIVQERLAWECRIDDASKLLPEAAGSLFAKGWFRWRQNEPAGALTAQGKKISYDDARLSSFSASAQMPEGYKGVLAVDITGRSVSYGIFRANTLNLKVTGRTDDHRMAFAVIHDRNALNMQAKGGYADGSWQGTIVSLSGTQSPFGRFDLAGPATVIASQKRLILSPFVLKSSTGERLDASADISTEPMTGSAAVKWQQVNLGRMDALIDPAKVQGLCSGAARVQWLTRKRLALSGEMRASAAFSQGSLKVKADSINGNLNWDTSGLRASLDVELAGEGRMNASAASRRPAAFSLPDRGTFQAAWKLLDMSMLQPILPGTVRLKGHLSGEVTGSLLPGGRFDLVGRTGVSEGSFTWRGDEGEIAAPIRETAIDWTWKDTSLRGKANLRLGRYGHVETAFRVPLPAKVPIAIDKGSGVMVSMRGTMSERGLLAALFPGLAQETRGQIDFDLTGSGTLADPRINGRLNLKGSSAYLPPAGIQLKDMSADVLFNNDRITLSSFVVHSGEGSMKTTGTLIHGMGKIKTFEGTLKGERFEAVNLPEFQVKISPDLAITGDPERVSVRGSILIPQALIRGEQKETLIKPSSDVIVKGREKDPRQALPFAIDVAVAVVLGEEVLVKAYGIDTRLAGRVNITMKDPEDIRASGGIRTVKGKFDAYGVKLDIRRGNISFGGGPVEAANLDILALRTVGDVSAGVLVAGTPASPLVNLYSQPAMADRDILSYIVLGRASGGAGKSDTALLARAASGLLTGGKASSVQKQLGLDVLDIESEGGDVSKSIVKLGKYLSPKLFVSYGRSIYTGENIFGIRYSLTKRVDVESTMGNQSGAAIYYRIEFD